MSLWVFRVLMDNVLPGYGPFSLEQPSICGSGGHFFVLEHFSELLHA